MEQYQIDAQEGRKRRARVEAEEKAAADAQAARIEQAEAPSRNINKTYWDKQEALAKQTAEQNAKNAAAQKQRDTDGAARRIAENEAARSYRGPNKPPEGFLDIYGTVPAPRKAPIRLTPQPDPEALSNYNMKKPQPGMAKREPVNPPMVVDFQERPARIEPKKVCSECGDTINELTVWHRRDNGEACILPGGEELARREGVVIKK